MRREKANLNIQLRPDLATMEINIVTDQRRIAGVILSPEELDRVMAGLADIRSKMTPEVPPEFPQGKPTHQHLGTKYRLEFLSPNRLNRSRPVLGLSGIGACPLSITRAAPC